MAVFRKLNLKDQAAITVLDPPPEFEAELATLEGVTVHRDPAELERVGFAIAFVATRAGIDAAMDALVPRLAPDAVLWFAYPKGSSKRYRCEFNRDTGWDRLGESGFEGVRQVSIDEDWSAIRFRRAEFIGRMTRDPSRARSAAGKERIARARAAEGP